MDSNVVGLSKFIFWLDYGIEKELGANFLTLFSAPNRGGAINRVLPRRFLWGCIILKGGKR